jgi:hypothetical protein
LQDCFDMRMGTVVEETRSAALFIRVLG